MKLRLDLLKHLTTDDVIQEAEATVHRFKPETLFSRTGTGSLSSASTQERAREVEHCAALTQSLEQCAQQIGQHGTGEK